MNNHLFSSPSTRDLSLLAIEAAEELERIRKDLPTSSNAIKSLSEILEKVFSKEKIKTEDDLRYDNAAIFSRAVTNSIDPMFASQNVNDMVKEANRISNLLYKETSNSDKDELSKMISFCVALSDSAALYLQELDELRKRVA